MAGETQLGKAVIPIRASLDDLDRDLSSARGKITGALGGLGRGIGVAGAAILGAGTAAVGVLGSIAVQSAPLEGVQNAFQGIATDADGMLSALRTGSRGMVADAELMRQYNQAAQLVGTTFADQLPDAMSYLGKVSAATGVDMGYLMNSLVTGVGRLQPLILDNLQVQVSLADATARAAQMYGVEEDALSKAQIQAGMAAVTMEALAANTADMPDVADNASTQIAQFTATMENLKAEVGMAFLPMLKEVMGVFSELAAIYGPMLAEVFGRLVEMLGPLLSGALETLIPAVMTLLDALIPLAEMLMNELMPVFAVVLEAVVSLAGTLLTALVPVLVTLLDAFLPVITTLIEMFVPVLEDLITALLPVIVPLIETVADTFARLAIALMPLIETLLVELVPVFIDIVETVLPPLIDILTILLDLFVTYVEATLPNFIDALNLILPIIGDLARIVSEVLGKALEALAGIFDNVVRPALEWAIEHLFEPINELLDRMAAGIEGVKGWFEKLGKTISDLSLPPWLTPGSPTPLELGLAGIGDELGRVTGLLGRCDSGLSMSVVNGNTGGQWTGDIVINGATDPHATASAVIRALQDRGIMPMTAFR